MEFIEIKRCSKCGEDKPLSEFRKSKTCKYGVRSECRCCEKTYAKQYRIENKEHIAVAYKQWRTANIDKVKLSNKQWHIENHDKRLEYYKRYRTENKEYRDAQSKQWRNNNAEYCKEYSKQYYNTHKEQVNQYLKKRRKENPHYRLSCNLRLRLWHALTSQKVKKNQSVLEMVGCSLDDLKNYLESKFTDGMSWNNYGEWHIDHIKPCASFDLTDPKQQKQCFHYTNLQPLWAEDNLKKSDKIT